jgi:predicted RNase H-like HicB family nuclease
MRIALALHTDDGKRYGVTVPDLPGCFSTGDSFDDAIDNAREAIDGHVELLIEGGEGVPEVHPIDAHINDKSYANALWAVIEVPVERYFGPAEKINITVPALTLKRIDEFAVQRGESRSGFLVRAAEESMRKAG